MSLDFWFQTGSKMVPGARFYPQWKSKIKTAIWYHAEDTGRRTLMLLAASRRVSLSVKLLNELRAEQCVHVCL